MKNKKYLLTLLVLVVAGVLLKRTLSTIEINQAAESPENFSLAAATEEDRHHHLEQDQTNHHVAGPKGNLNQKSKDEKSIEEIQLPSKKEILDVIALGKDYPRSKSILIAKIISPDPYSEQKKDVEPHSLNEIKQRQQGALKVIALRVLVEKEKNKETLLKDLAKIRDEASDPTLKGIAQAALKSAGQNRSFFEDFPKAVSQSSF